MKLRGFHFEVLEDRQLLAVTQVSDTLTIVGTADDDFIEVDFDGPGLISVSGDAGTGDFSGVNSVVINGANGNERVIIEDSMIGSDGRLIDWNIEGGSGTLAIFTNDEFEFRGELRNRGNIEIVSETITIADGSIISTRDLHPASQSSQGNSGDLLFLAPDDLFGDGPEISIGDNVQIRADADNDFRAGNVTFSATASIDLDFLSATPFFSRQEAVASIHLGSADIRGRNILIETDTETTKFADISIDPNAGDKIIEDYFARLSDPLTTELTFDDPSISMSNAAATSVDFFVGQGELADSENTQLNFANAGATIVRSSGSWIDDGFAPGRYTEIRGSENNDGHYLIASLTDDTMTLQFGTLLVGEIGSNVEVLETDRITRSSGSWIDDGFSDNQFIAVNDAPGTNGFFQIATAQDSTLFLTQHGVLTDSNHTDVSVTDTDRIERSRGDWIADRFDAGQLIAIVGSLNNDGFARVLGATADELFVASAEEFQDETRPGVEVVQTLSGIGDGDNPTRQTAADSTELSFFPAAARLGNLATSSISFEEGSAALTGTPELTFDGVISRSTGSWIDDGFAIGQQVRVVNTAANDGLFLITEVSAEELTVDTTLMPEVASTADVEQTDSIQREIGSWLANGFVDSMWISIEGADSNNGFTEIHRATSKILHLTTRGGIDSALPASVSIGSTDSLQRSSGSWTDDGFVAGQRIFVSDSTANDSLYTILSVQGDTLVLEEVGKLSPGTDLGARVTESIMFPELTFSGGVIAGGGTTPAGDTITRSSGSWVDDGFHVGMNIVFENVGDNDGEFTIAEVTDETIRLFQSNFLFDEVSSPALTYNTELQFSPGDDGDTITRSTGSWIEEGYFVDQVIQVDFSEHNNALFRIFELTDDTLTLVEENQMVSESSELAIVRGQADVTEILNTLTAEQVPLIATDQQGNVIETTVDQVQDLLVQPATQLSLLNDIVGVAQGVLSNTDSDIQIGDGASLTAEEGIEILARATSEVSIKSPYLKPPGIPGLATFGVIGDLGLPLAVGFGSAEASANATIGSNVEIVAGGQFSLHADVRNDFDISMQTYAGTLQSAKTLVRRGGRFAGFGPLRSLTSQVSPARIADSLPVKMPAPTVTLAYGRARSDSNAHVETNTTITADSVVVDAENLNNFGVSTGSFILFPEKNLGQGLSVSVSDVDSTSSAQVDGDILATDIVIRSVATNDTNSNTASVLIKEKIPGTGAAEKVSRGPLEPLGDRFDNTNQLLKNENVLSDSVGPSAFGLAAGFAVAVSSNSAEAIVGPNADLRASTGRVEVAAAAQDNFTSGASGTSNAAAQVNLGGGFNVGIYENDAEASIGDRATVTAGDSVTVEATAEIPNQISIDDEFLSIVEGFSDFVYSPPEFDPVVRLEAPEVDLSAPNVNVDDREVDFPPPTIDLGDSTSTASSVQTEMLEQVTYAAGTGTSLLAPIPTFIRGFVDPKNLGLDRTYTSNASGSANGKTKAGEGKFAFGGSVNIQTLDNEADAWIGEGATVTAGLGNVNVLAKTMDQTLNVAGAANLIPFFTDGLKSGSESQGVILGGTINGTYTTKDANAWIADGAEVMSVAGDVVVQADNESLIINMAQAGGTAGAVGINGTFGVQIVFGTTRAFIEDTAQVSAGRDILLNAQSDIRSVDFGFAFTGGDVVGVGVTAVFSDFDLRTEAFVGNHSDSSTFATIGTVTAGGDVVIQAENDELLLSLGFAGAQAEGADTEPSKKTTGGGLNDLLLNSGLAAQATDSSGLASGVILGANQVDEATLKDRIAENDKAEGKGKLETLKDAAKEKFSFLPGVGDDAMSSKERTVGIGISGDIVINLVESDTRAFIDERQVVNADNDRGLPQDDGTGGDVLVHANNESILVGLTMALAIGGQGKGAAIAGSAAFNILDRGTSAHIGSGAQVLGNNISVIADADDEHFTFTAGGGGAKSKEEDSVGVVGSAAAHYLENDTLATVHGSARLIAIDNVLIEAENKTQVLSIAGALGFAGGAGIGAAPEIVIIDNDADAIIAANADVQAGGNVVLSADNQEDVLSIAASLAIGVKKLGVSGAGNLQLILSEANAEIAGGASVLANGTVWVDANDLTRLLGFGGGGAFGEETGFGAGLSANIIVRDVEAKIGTGAVVTGLGQVSADDPAGSDTERFGVVVEATSEEGIINYAGSGAISNEVAIAGSWSPVIIATETDATIDDEARINVEAGPTAVEINPDAIPGPSNDQSVFVRADHDSRLTVAAGTLGVGKEDVGVGAALVSTLMIRQVEARIGRRAEVNAEKHVELHATAEDRVLSLAAGIGGSGGLAGTGVISSIVVAGETNTHIDEDARVVADGNVVVSTVTDSQVLSVAGEVAFGKEQGLGASVANVVLLDLNRADIANGSVVIARGNQGGTAVPSGERSNVASGPDTVDVTGVSVNSVSFDDAVSITAGANIGLNVGLTGSLGATVSVDINRAEVSPGSFINVDPNQVDPLHPDSLESDALEFQDARVLASNKSNSISIAGGFSGSKSAGVGAAVGTSFVVRIIEANVEDATIKADAMDVLAESDGLLVSGALGAAVAASDGTPPIDSTDDFFDDDVMTGLFQQQTPVTTAQSSSPFAGTGSVSGNVLFTKVDATVIESDVDLTGSLVLSANDETIAVAGAGAVAVAATNSVGGAGGGAVGASLTANLVTTLLDSRIDSSNVRADGDVMVLTESTPLLIAAAIAGAGDGSGSEAGGTLGTGAGSVAVNLVVSEVDSAITNHSTVESAGDVMISAKDDAPGRAPTIIALAGALSIAGIGGTDAASAVGVGAAFNGNNVTSLVDASIDNSAVDSGGSLSVVADTQAFIVAASLGVGGNLTGGAAGGATFTAVGSATVNSVIADVHATVSTANVAVSDDLIVSANDGARIGAGAGGASVAIGLGAGAGSATALEASAAINVVVSDVEARVKDTAVIVGDDLTIAADTSGEIFSAALAGSGAGTGGAGGGNTNGLGGAIAINLITRDVHALMENLRDRKTVQVDGSALIEAHDSSQIIAAVGGLTLAISGGAGGGNSNGAGAAIALNSVSNRAIEAGIANVDLTTVDDLTIHAISEARIAVATLGLSGGGSAGVGAGTVITAAGSGSANVVVNNLDAVIQDSRVNAMGHVDLHAGNATFIGSGAGTLAIGGAGGGGDGSSIAFGASLIANTITTSVDAAITNSEVAGASIDVEADNTSTIYAAALAGQGAGVGGGGAGNSIGSAAAVVVNTVVGNVTAEINSNSFATTTTGRIGVIATDRSQVMSLVGDALVEAAVGAGGGNAAGIGAAISVTNLRMGVEAQVSDSHLDSAGNIRVSASYERPDGFFAWPESGYRGPDLPLNILTATVGLAGTGTGGVGEGGTLTGVGSGTSNSITGDVHATVENSMVDALGKLTVIAKSEAAIGAGAGGASIAAAGAAAGSSVALGASLVLNIVNSSVLAFIDESIVNVDGADVRGNSQQDLWGAALAGAGAGTGGMQGNAVSAAGAGVSNVVVNSVEATITNKSMLNSTDDVNLIATDESRAVAVAGTVTVAAVAAGEGNAGAVNGSIGINTVTNNVSSSITGQSQVSAIGDVVLNAESAQELIAASLGLGGSGSGGSGAIAFSTVGSGSANVLVNDVEAFIEASDVNASGSVSLIAVDDSTLGSGAGGAAISIAGGSGGGQVAIGVSIAGNIVTNNIDAFLHDAQVTSLRDVTVSATNSADTFAGALAGAGGGAGGATGIAIDAAAAGAANTIVNSVNAEIRGNTNVLSNRHVAVSANDESQLVAAAGEGTLALGIGEVGVAVAVGASVAVNTVTNTVQAEIGRPLFDEDVDPSLDSDDANDELATVTIVNAGGDVTISADSRSEATAASLGFDASGAGGGVGVAVSVAGSLSVNVISNNIDAGIVSGAVSIADVDAGGSITIEAADSQQVSAGAGGVAIAAAGGEVGVAVPVGGSASINVVDSSIDATILKSKVVAGENVKVDAYSNVDINTHAMAGSGGGSGGLVGVQVSGSGVVTSTTTNIDTNAEILESDVSTTSGNVTIVALDETNIITAAGGLTAAGSGGAAVGVNVGFGGAVAENVVLNTVSATVSSSTLQAGNNVVVDAKLRGDISAASAGFSVGGTGGFFAGVAVDGAGSITGTLYETTVDAIVENSEISSGNHVNVRARDVTTIGAGAGGAAINGAGGTAGVAVAVAGSAALNGITGTVNALIDDSTIHAVGNVLVRASTASEITSLGLAGTGNGAGGIAGVAIGGAGVVTVNVIDVNVTAKVFNESTIQSSGNVNVEAVDRAQVLTASGAGTVAGSGGIVGVTVLVAGAFANNIVENDVLATITDNSNVDATNDLRVLAVSGNDIKSFANGVTGGLSGGVISVTAAGTGSFTFNDIDGSTIASIDSANASAMNISTDAQDTSSILSNAGALAVTIGAAGLPIQVSVAGAVAVNDSDHTVRSTIVNSSTDASNSTDINSSATTKIETITGSGALSLSGGVGGTVNASAAVSTAINDIDNTLESLLENGINVSSASLNVTATDDSEIIAKSAGGVITFGASAVINGSLSIGTATATNEINNVIHARIDSTEPDVGDIIVAANSTANIESFSVAATVAGNVSFLTSAAIAGGGAASVNNISNEIIGEITNSLVNSDGNVSIFANENSTIVADVGSGALSVSGSPFSVGASVGVSVADSEIRNTIRAFVNSSPITAQGDITIAADAAADSDVTSVATSLAIGAASLAGAGSEAKSTFHSTVEAFVESDSPLDAGETVSIRANVDTNTRSDSDGIAAGVAGAVGAAVSEVHISGPVVSRVNDQARVSAKNLIVATSTRHHADSGSIAAGGGLLFGVTENSSSIRIDPEVRTLIGESAIVETSQDVNVSSSANLTADSDTRGVSVGVGVVGVSLSTVDIIPTFHTRISQDASIDARNVDIEATGQHDLSSIGEPSVRVGGGSGGGVDATAHLNPTYNVEVASGANIEARRNVRLHSNTTGTADAVSTDITIGLAGLGISKATVDVEPVIRTGIRRDANVVADGSIDIDSIHVMDRPDEAGIVATAVAPGGGIIAGNGAVAHATFHQNIDAFVERNAHVSSPEGVSLVSKSTATVDADSDAINVAGLGVGTSVANATIRGANRSRFVGNEIKPEGTISGGIGLESLNLHEANANAEAAAGGLFNGVGAESNALIRSVARSVVADNLTLSAVHLNSETQNKAVANAEAVVIGGVSAGGTIANATITSPTAAGFNTLASIGPNTQISGPNATVIEVDSRNETLASAEVTGGGILSGQGANATATTSPTTRAQINDGVVIDTRGAVIIEVESTNKATADSDGTSIGLLAAAAAVAADAEISPITQTVISPNTQIYSRGGRHIVIDTASHDEAVSNAVASAGGVVSGAGSVANSNVDSTVETLIGRVDGSAGTKATLLSTGTIAVETGYSGTADADARGASIGLAGSMGVSWSNADLAPEVRSVIGKQTDITSHSFSVNTNVEFQSDVDSRASNGAFISGTASDATSTIAPRVFTTMEDNVDITLGGNLQLELHSEADADARARGSSLSVVGGLVGGSTANSTIRPILKTSVGDANIDARDITVITTHNRSDAIGEMIEEAKGATAESHVTAGSLIIGNGESSAQAVSSPQIDSLIGVGAHVDARDVTINTTVSNRADAFVDGAVFSGAAASDLNAMAKADGSASARLGNVDTGLTGTTTLTARNLDISTVSADRSNAHVYASQGGVISGFGNQAMAVSEPLVKAFIGPRTTIHVSEDVDVDSFGLPYAESDVEGDSGGGITAGKSVSRAEAKPNIRAFIATGSDVHSSNDVKITAHEGQSFILDDEGEIETRLTAGNVLALASGSMGSLIGINGVDVDGFYGGVVEAYVDERLSIGNSVNAGRDVIISSHAIPDVNAQGSTETRGGFGEGQAIVVGEIMGVVRSFIDDSVSVTAGRTFDMVASDVEDQGSFVKAPLALVAAIASGGGVIERANAEGTAHIGHNVVASVRDDAEIIAEDEISILSTSGATPLSIGIANVQGLGVDANGRGVGRVSRSRLNPDSYDESNESVPSESSAVVTRTDIQDRAQLRANEINLDSIILAYNVQPDGAVGGESGGSNLDAEADLLVNSLSEINIGPNAVLMGSESVSLRVLQGTVRTSASANSESESIAGDTDAEASAAIFTRSKINTAAESEIVTPNLLLKSSQIDDFDWIRMDVEANRDAELLFIGFLPAFDVGSAKEDRRAIVTQEIDFNSTVTLSQPKVELTIQNNGTIVDPGNHFTVNESSSRFRVDGLKSLDEPGRITFTIEEIEVRGIDVENEDFEIDLLLQGDPDIRVAKYASDVSINNQSSQDLMIRNLDLELGNVVPSIRFLADLRPFSLGQIGTVFPHNTLIHNIIRPLRIDSIPLIHDPLSNTTQPDFSVLPSGFANGQIKSQLTISNTRQGNSDPDIIFTGEVNNPTGDTNIRITDQGDVLAGPEHQMTTHRLDVAISGDLSPGIGQFNRPLNVFFSNDTFDNLTNPGTSELYARANSVRIDLRATERTVAGDGQVEIDAENIIQIINAMYDVTLTHYPGELLVEQSDGSVNPTVVGTRLQLGNVESEDGNVVITDENTDTPALLGTVTARNGFVVVDSRTRNRIVDDNGAAINVVADTIVLQAKDGAIGGSQNPIEVRQLNETSGEFAARANGNIWITQPNGTLRIFDVDSNEGHVNVEVFDSASPSDNIAINSGGTVFAGRSVTLKAGDDFDIPFSSGITGEQISIGVGFGTTDGIGGTLNLQGNLSSDELILIGGGNLPDEFNIGFIAQDTSVIVFGADGDDTYRLVPNPLGESNTTSEIRGTLVVDGQAGIDTAEGAFAQNTWNIESFDDGSVDGDSPFLFRNIENLIGHEASDDFVFSDGAGLHGLIDGGPGFDTLDYRAYTTQVFVDLAANIATNVFQGVYNIEHRLLPNIENEGGGGEGEEEGGEGPLGIPSYDFGQPIYVVSETNGTSTTQVVTVHRTVETSIPTSVDVFLTGLSATSGSDFAAGPIRLNFPAGVTTLTVPIEVFGDTLIEGDETIGLSFTNMSPAGNFGTSIPSSTLTLVDDDQLSIVGVKVGSTDWAAAFKTAIDTTGQGFGYPIPVGTSQQSPLPWANINQIQLQFSQNIGDSFASEFFGLGGVQIPDYRSHILETVYDANNFAVTITLDSAIGDDQLLLVVSDLIHEPVSGAALDGEWTTGQSRAVSGDGLPGGSFEFYFRVLPGDVNQSGQLRANDGFASLQRQFQDIGSLNYLAFADIDGSGTIRANDGFYALQRQFTELPVGDPAPPPMPRAALVDIALAMIQDEDRVQLGQLANRRFERIVVDEVVDFLD